MLIIDMDYMKWSCASVGEKRTVVVTHLPSGNEKIFKTRTEFKGQGKTIGGWLGQVNKQRTEAGKELFTLDQFAFRDIQTPEPVENVLHTIKVQMDSLLHALDTREYKGFVGAGDSFRLGRSSIVKYKGDRENLLKPLYLETVTNYMISKYGAEVVTDVEADDRCVMECYRNDNVLVGVDKDYCGSPVKLYNPDHPEAGIIDNACFGGIYRDEKGKVRGTGRMFFYYQVAYGDDSDCYHAHSASDVKHGPVAAFKALGECTTDREALEALVELYKRLYPEPKVVQGWRGDNITVDWIYALEENWALARMLRFRDDAYAFQDALQDALFEKTGMLNAY